MNWPGGRSATADKILAMIVCPERGGLPADSLQNNSDSLQRNSNITAIEFQQLQTLRPLG
jgi:hypothetical protein